jgi:hypothetical protein
MYELLLRMETLFLGLQTPALLAIGIGAIVVGLVLWLGGTRHSVVIIGLFGAAAGSAAGLLVSQRLNLNPWLSLLAGAVVLAGVSILLRNVLILVLAVLVFSAVSGAGYVSVVLDRAVPQVQSKIQAEQSRAFQYFSGMDLDARQKYVNEISQEAQTFAERLKALLADTGEALGPNGWRIAIAIAAGAVVGILLVWLIAKIVIALAYSIVGTATNFSARAAVSPNSLYQTFTTVVAAVAGGSPTGPCAEASPRRSTISGSSSGRRKRSTAGKRRVRPSRSRSRTAQPVKTTRIPGFEPLSARRTPWRPITFASAASRIAQVLMTTRSAASIDGASAHPAARRRPAISSESLLFIWQPSVQTQKRGRAWSSGRNSATRPSSGATGGRGAPSRAAGGRISRTGSSRVLIG